VTPAAALAIVVDKCVISVGTDEGDGDDETATSQAKTDGIKDTAFSMEQSFRYERIEE
jgi:hypothetical protein